MDTKDYPQGYQKRDWKVFQCCLLTATLLMSVACRGRSAANSSPRHPFGSHPQAYTAHTLKPSQTAAQLDAATQSFYDTWKMKFLSNAECGENRYYIDPYKAAGFVEGGSSDPNSISISEGHGYGMIIMVLMAGYDPQAQTYFDGMFRMLTDHPALGAPALMAWNQVHGCKNATGGNDNATDGDLDIAYALLLADRQWGSAGAIDYLNQARKMIATLAAQNVDLVNHYLFLGTSSAADPVYSSGTRPSDFMMDHFRAFDVAMGGAGRWTDVLDKSYAILSYVQATASPNYGLVPDFIVGAQTSTPVPAPLTPQIDAYQRPVMMYLEGPTDNQYYSNACRVPWRIATDYLVFGEGRAKSFIDILNAGILKITEGNIERLAAGYRLDGTALQSFASQEFTAPLAVAAMLSSDQAWMDATYKNMISTKPDGYYDSTLKMLSLLTVSNNWWVP
jgi:endo-1,4-beta-D-glucanase Y